MLAKTGKHFPEELIGQGYVPWSRDLFTGVGLKEDQLGPPVVPFLTLFMGEGSPTKIDYRKKGALILTSLLQDLANLKFLKGAMTITYTFWEF